MRTFLIRRLLAAIPLIIAVTFITKALLVASPGNYLDTLRLTPSISREYVQQMERMYHLDSNNVFERYWYWVWPAEGQRRWGQGCPLALRGGHWSRQLVEEREVLVAAQRARSLGRLQPQERPEPMVFRGWQSLTEAPLTL